MKTRFLALAMIVISITACGRKGREKEKEEAAPSEIAVLEKNHEAHPTDTSALKELGRAYAKAGKIDDAIRLSFELQEALKDSSYILSLYERGMFEAELYRIAGDEESAEMALEDARIFINRQGWGELSESDKALMEECLEHIAAASVPPGN